MVRPLLSEYSRLIKILRAGATMQMSLADGSTVERVHVRVSHDFSTLAWSSASSNSSKNNAAASSSSVKLADIAAIMCGGRREARPSPQPENRVFRVHFRRGGVTPLTFAAMSKEQRQDWSLD